MAAILPVGAVSAVSNVRNPVALAAEIMRKEQPYFYAGQALETFAKSKVSF